MATHDEEFQKHRELMAAAMMQYAAAFYERGEPLGQLYFPAVLEHAFSLADQLIAHSRTPRAVDIDGRTGEPVP